MRTALRRDRPSSPFAFADSRQLSKDCVR